ncbi:MAG: MFS transporter [Parvularculaceae bacterium]
MLLSLAALLASAAILLAGGGLQGTLVAVRANLENFPLPVIGLLMSTYYVGFIAGCLIAPSMVARAGHIRTFGALAAMAAAAALIYALSVHIVLWLALRLLTGFCFAGLYMIVESWINEKCGNRDRGKVLSVYRIVDLVAMTVGQFLLTLAPPEGFALFSLVSILITLSIVPVAMTKSIAPEPLTQTRLNVAKLFRISPFAAAGVLGVGMANGAFWALGPVYVQKLGFDLEMVAMFMSVAIVAGALAQWPIGYLSDLLDRRKVLLWTGAAAAASGAFLSAVGVASPTLLLLGGALYGVFAMPIFGLSAAHANDHAEADEFVSISSGLLLVYGVGSIAGAAIAPLLMDATGPAALFAYTAGVHSLLFAFGFYRILGSPAVPADEQADYVPVPRTSPAVFEIDPRSGDDEATAAV